MKKITLLMGTFFLMFSIQAQSVLFEQTSANAAAFISGYSVVSSFGIFSADDFNLTGQTEISSVTVYGFQPDNNLDTYVTGFSLYIYADAAGVPSGNPSVPGSGILEIEGLPISSPALNIEHPSTLLYNFTVDIVTSEGAPLTLSAGTYWILAVPHLNIDAATIDPIGDDRLWYWFLSSQQQFSDARFIDPTNFFGGGWTSWTLITDFPTSSASEKALAFTILGNQLSIEETAFLNEVSLYPNPVKNQLHINVPNGLVIESASVYDLLGKRHTMKIGENNTLEMSQMPSGIYLLKLETTAGSLTKKFIKE
ncbi:MAG TPA: T9SS type A sorting domain-containing protein [Flavobacteriaceae bacterium]|nr:T9SS type A sorting domain-containing protein [Flavobacteriaceae bacterium]